MNSKDFLYTFTGKLTPDCHSITIDHGSSMSRILKPIVDDPLEITIKKFYRKRTNAQNNWIWGPCIITIRAHMKEKNGVAPSAEAVYLFLRVGVCKQEVVIETINGVDLMVVKGKHFSEMTTVEFAQKVEEIVEYYATEEGVEIPLPKPKTNNYITDYINDYKDE